MVACQVCWKTYRVALIILDCWPSIRREGRRSVVHNWTQVIWSPSMSLVPIVNEALSFPPGVFRHVSDARRLLCWSQFEWVPLRHPQHLPMQRGEGWSLFFIKPSPGKLVLPARLNSGVPVEFKSISFSFKRRKKLLMNIKEVTRQG